MGNLVGWRVGEILDCEEVCSLGGIGCQFYSDSREGLSFSQRGYLVLEVGFNGGYLVRLTYLVFVGAFEGEGTRFEEVVILLSKIWVS